MSNDNALRLFFRPNDKLLLWYVINYYYDILLTNDWEVELVGVAALSYAVLETF